MVNLDLLTTLGTLDWSSHSLNQISGMVYIIGGLIVEMWLEFSNLFFVLYWNLLPKTGLLGRIWNVSSWFTEQILWFNVPFSMQNDWSFIELPPWLKVWMQSLFWHLSVHRWFHHIWGVNVWGQTSVVTSFSSSFGLFVQHCLNLGLQLWILSLKGLEFRAHQVNFFSLYFNLSHQLFIFLLQFCDYLLVLLSLWVKILLSHNIFILLIFTN